MISKGPTALAAISSITVTEDLRITEGHGPSQVAVNTQTHLVYVTNPAEQIVTVIKQEDNGFSDNGNSPLMHVVGTIEVPNAFGIAVNPLTNMVYVSGYTESSVYVVNGSTNRVTSVITVGSAPRGVTVNPSTNTVYVANFASDSISVIDGSTNEVIDTIKAGEGNMQEGPRGLAIDKETNMLYVANWLSDSVSIIDTSTNTVVGKVLDVGQNPSAIAVNEKTGKVYVMNRNSVSVINASNNHELITSLSVEVSEMGNAEYALGGIAVNQETNLVYFTNRMSNSTTIIDGDEDNVIAANITNSVIKSPQGIAVDEGLDFIYIASQSSNSLTLINGSNHQIRSSIQIGGWPSSIALNPKTNMIYVGNYNDAGSVSILNGTAGDNLIGTISFGQYVMDVEVNDKTNKIYVLISTVEPDGFPRGTVIVIDGNTNSIIDRISIAALAPATIAIDTKTNMLYIGHDGYNHHTITVIDGATNEVASSINTGYNYPLHLAVNEEDNKLYVAIREPSIVLMYNGSSNDSGAIEDSEPIKTPISGWPAGIDVNPETDMVYVTDYWNSTVSVIDGSTGRVVKTLAGFGASPTGVAVNPKTNTIYVTNNSFDTLTVIDGSSNEIVAELVTGEAPLGVAVNPESGAAYVTNSRSGTILKYDESQINASKSRMIPFSLTARVMPTTPSASAGDASSSNNTVTDQQSQDDNIAAFRISGKAQDVKVTDIIIKPQENMLVINYARTDDWNSDESGTRGDIKGGIIEVTLPTSIISDIYQIRFGGLSQHLQDDAKIVANNTSGFFIRESDYYLTNPAPTYTNISSNSTSHTIKMIVPPGTDSIEILGAAVIPEFGTSLAAMIATASIASTVLAVRYLRK